VVCLKKMDNFAQLKQGLMEVNIDNEHADDLAKKLIAEGLKNLTKVKRTPPTLTSTCSLTLKSCRPQ